MYRPVIIWLTVGALGLGTVLGGIWLRRADSDAGPSQAVYVCRESGEIFLGRGQSAPQVHPETGRPSLFPGLYCSNCRAWMPAPQLERLYGHAELLECPKCKSRRTFQGRVPENVREL